MKENLTMLGVRAITLGLWKQGVTTYLPTLTTESDTRFCQNLQILATAMNDPEIGPSIPGIHLEGPYISAVDGYRGAHPKQWVRKPNWEEFQRWWEISEGRIIEITLAPELEGAIPFIEKCVEQGIVVALGHHNANALQIQEAVKAGASVSTHLGNGCANLIHRHHNPLWPQLAADQLYASLIADGHHLTPEELRVFYKVKGPEKTILVSDITRLAGMPPGKYEDFGREVVMTKGGAIMMPDEAVLAGASLPLRYGIAHMKATTNCSWAEAIQMVSRNPAQLLGWKDRGELAVGMRGDLTLFRVETDQISVEQVYLAGKRVLN